MQTDLLDPKSNTALTPVTRSAPPVVSGNTANILSLIQHGMASGQSAQAIEILAGVYERAIANDAKAAFTAAKKAFQAECPVIGKNKHADLGAGKAKYDYADLEKITTVIRPLLEKHGFTYSFTQAYSDKIVTVSCILKHEAGHEESTPFAGPWETNAGMSAIQKSASATTFCQRYALRLALGLPVGEDDEVRLQHDNPDAKSDAPNVTPRDEGPKVTKEQLAAITVEWKTQHNGEATKEAFAAWAKETVGQADWNPNKLGDWLQSDIAKCHKALGMF